MFTHRQLRRLVRKNTNRVHDTIMRDRRRDVKGSFLPGLRKAGCRPGVLPKSAAKNDRIRRGEANGKLRRKVVRSKAPQATRSMIGGYPYRRMRSGRKPTVCRHWQSTGTNQKESPPQTQNVSWLNKRGRPGLRKPAILFLSRTLPSPFLPLHLPAPSVIMVENCRKVWST